MTVIAFDGKKLVADKAGTNAGYARTVTKIFKVPEGMVGFTGNAIHAQQLLEWFMNGCPPDRYPNPFNDNDHASALLITTAGRILHFEEGPIGLEVHEKFDAVGSGRDYALAAMFMGADAEKAVLVACHFDIHCGNGFDVITLAEIQAPNVKFGPPEPQAWVNPNVITSIPNDPRCPPPAGVCHQMTMKVDSYPQIWTNEAPPQ